tara:strand:- start:396 stop:695 length:300 start_codon:yes stop_codon:yes gene_type:complete
MWKIICRLSQNREGCHCSWLCAGRSKKGIAGVVAGSLAKASALPEDTIDLLLGAVVNPDGPRGIANVDLALGKDIFGFASGEFANTGDWSAAAGLKMRW